LVIECIFFNISFCISICELLFGHQQIINLGKFLCFYVINVFYRSFLVVNIRILLISTVQSIQQYNLQLYFFILLVGTLKEKNMRIPWELKCDLNRQGTKLPLYLHKRLFNISYFTYKYSFNILVTARFNVNMLNKYCNFKFCAKRWIY
jgi:hypothetical protein